MATSVYGEKVSVRLTALLEGDAAGALSRRERGKANPMLCADGVARADDRMQPVQKDQSSRTRSDSVAMRRYAYDGR
jgi:hypothetical protein